MRFCSGDQNYGWIYRGITSKLLAFVFNILCTRHQMSAEPLNLSAPTLRLTPECKMGIREQSIVGCFSELCLWVFGDAGAFGAAKAIYKQSCFSHFGNLLGLNNNNNNGAPGPYHIFTYLTANYFVFVCIRNYFPAGWTLCTNQGHPCA